MKIKRPVVWVAVILTIIVVGYCLIYGLAIMMAPRM